MLLNRVAVFGVELSISEMEEDCVVDRNSGEDGWVWKAEDWLRSTNCMSGVSKSMRIHKRCRVYESTPQDEVLSLRAVGLSEAFIFCEGW